MGFSYTVYCGPAFSIKMNEGLDFIYSDKIQDYIDEELMESRIEMNYNDSSIYFIPNIYGFGIDLDADMIGDEPFSMNGKKIENELARFESHFDNKIQIIKGIVENAEFSVEWIVLMDAI